MDFSNEFEVQAPLETVWNAMLDVEQVAPCVPGATVLEQTGDDAYKVGIKVKVGPVTMNYRGNVEIVERDADAHRAIMTAKAREARGQGTATARVTMDLAESGSGTTGTIATHLKLSGKAAAMGAGVVQEVSAKITDQFSKNLATMLEGEPEPASESATAASGQAPATDGDDATGGEAAQAPKEEPPAQPGVGAAAEEPAQQPAGVGARAHDDDGGAAFDDDSSLDMLSIIRSVATERLKDPHVALGAVGVAFAVGFVVGRAGR